MPNFVKRPFEGRRRGRRRRLQLPLRVTGQDAEGSTFTEDVQTLNIGEGGVAFYTHHRLRPRDRVAVSLLGEEKELGVPRLVDQSCRVVWQQAEPTGGKIWFVGVEFQREGEEADPGKKSDQRASQRKALSLPIRVEGQDIRGRYFTEVTRTVDVGREGLFFALSHAVKEGSTLKITLQTPASGQKPATSQDLPAKVVRIEVHVLPMRERRVAVALGEPLQCAGGL